MDIIVGENDELFVRPLIWRVFDDDDDEDRDDFKISEIRCCNCFIDQIKYLISEKKIVTFDFIYNNVTHPPETSWVSAGDLFFFIQPFLFFVVKNINQILKLFLDSIRMKWMNLALHIWMIIIVFIICQEKLYFLLYVTVVEGHY